ncbi:uncharacterized protein [Antedon mediterranea]|uniref:uncharacterized protein isoform X2 n=1 Tax=Antedon mediterranea TaxID=105859 RepID=UPI003AF8275F
MDLTEMLFIKVIFVILIVNGDCAIIREVEDEIQRNRPTDSYVEMRAKSYKHTPQEFLQFYGPKNVYDVYEVFHTLYLEAFPSEENPSHSDTDIELQGLTNEFENSRCKVPKMKIIDLYEELDIPADIIISPPAANVSRCGTNSGCCPKGQTCYHTGDNFKNKTVMVLYIDGDDISVRRYDVPEHDKCECTVLQPSTSSSSAVPTTGGDYDTSPLACQKMCTSLFQQDRYCQCNVCAHEKQKSCDRLKKGKRTLSEADALCVETGQCEEPFCNHGRYYDTHNNKCELRPVKVESTPDGI